jgi:hypothetical protein
MVRCGPVRYLWAFIWENLPSSTNHIRHEHHPDNKCNSCLQKLLVVHLQKQCCGHMNHRVSMFGAFPHSKLAMDRQEDNHEIPGHKEISGSRSCKHKAISRSRSCKTFAIAVLLLQKHWSQPAVKRQEGNMQSSAVQISNASRCRFEWHSLPNRPQLMA